MHLLHAAAGVAVNLFIGVMVFWMLFWDAERANPVRRHLVPRIEPLFVWLGLHATWTMFAPDPPARTIWPRVRLTTASGQTVDWEPTPPARLGVRDRIRFKKFYRYYHDVARPGGDYHTKRDFVEYLLRRGIVDEPVVTVEIFTAFTRTPPFHDPAPDGTVYRSRVFTFHPPPPEGAA